jgi:hypothetical protein
MPAPRARTAASAMCARARAPRRFLGVAASQRPRRRPRRPRAAQAAWHTPRGRPPAARGCSARPTASDAVATRRRRPLRAAQRARRAPAASAQRREGLGPRSRRQSVARGRAGAGGGDGGRERGCWRAGAAGRERAGLMTTARARKNDRTPPGRAGAAVSAVPGPRDPAGPSPAPGARPGGVWRPQEPHAPARRGCGASWRASRRAARRGRPLPEAPGGGVSVSGGRGGGHGRAGRGGGSDFKPARQAGAAKRGAGHSGRLRARAARAAAGCSPRSRPPGAGDCGEQPSRAARGPRPSHLAACSRSLLAGAPGRLSARRLGPTPPPGVPMAPKPPAPPLALARGRRRTATQSL